MLDAIRSVASRGHVVPLFIGSRWPPRHVASVLDAQLTPYDPATGLLGAIPAEQFSRPQLSVSGWSHPWFAILPR